jgi:4-hydroxybenzoate polyprenyltransferase
VFIAACALAFCMETNIILSLPFNSFSFYAFVFGATLAQYNLHYLVKTAAVENSERLHWSQENRKVHLLMFFFGVILILICLFGIHLRHFIILAFFGLIAFLYSFPFLPFGKKKRLKDYGLGKILTITLLWTLVTVWFPVNTMSFDKGLFAFIFLKRFVFMFVLCLLFDMRDEAIDRKENIRTLAVILGRKKCYLLAYLSLILFVVFSIGQYIYYPHAGFLIAMLISAVATMITIELTRKSNSDFIYLAAIDGMMLLQAVLVYVLRLKF